MRYRAEIDGLRAIAVVPVILFHAGLSIFSGGFVGVDIFFVISGYLITTIIISELNQGNFSIIGFYERRARRILPALFFVMLMCLPIAWLYFLPKDFVLFSKSLVAVSTFSSNLLFLSESGYFDTASELKPLLHTWSLAVEEQYYIFFPLMLIFMWRLNIKLMLSILIIMAILSLAIAQWAVHHRPALAFYLLPTRGWELLLGAILSFYLYKKQDNISFNRITNQIMSMVGVVLIIYAIFNFDNMTPVPSFYTVIPTLGTVLIILFAREGTLVHSVLTTRVFVMIGLISYSAYLWHQPLFAFAKYISLNEPSMLLMMCLCILTFPLAYFSWRFIEKPFRNPKAVGRKMIFIQSGVGISIFIILGLVGVWQHGFKSRIPNTIFPIIDAVNDKNPDRERCGATPTNYLSPKEACFIGNQNNIVGVLLGDSHSDAVAYSLGQELNHYKIGLKHMWYSGCPPIKGLYRIDSRLNYQCELYNDEVWKIIKQDTTIRNIVLVARFTMYLESDKYNNGEGGVETGGKVIMNDVALKEVKYTELQRKNAIKQRYIESIRSLLNLGKNVVLVYPIPEVGWNVPNYAAKKAMFYGDSFVSTSYTRFLERNKDTIATLDAIGEHENLKRVYPERLLCNSFVKNRCIATLNGHSLYYDDDHLSNHGANYIVKEISQYLNR